MSALPATKALARRKVMLVVDPEHHVDSLLQRLASEEGWNVDQVPNNESVLSLLQTTTFDLIITGQRTSGSEDLQLLRKLRTVRPHARMIILANAGTPEDVIAALREHAFSYFRAPIELPLLREIVRMAMTAPPWDEGIEVISASPRWIRLLARCTIDTAGRLVQFLREADLPETEKNQLAIAVHEVLLNAMEHGGNYDPSRYVEIGYLRAKHVVVCRVKDPGQGFSLHDLQHAAVNSPPGDLFSHLIVREKKSLRPGGFGLLVATKQVDEIIYGEKGNDVILVKYLPPVASQTTPNLVQASTVGAV